MSNKIIITRADALATITLNRPQVMNALDWEMIRSLREACETVEQDSAVRAVLLTGTEPAFCAGGDVMMFRANLAQLPALILEGARELHHAVLALRRMPKPVVAAVHGVAAGAGMSLLAAADLAIAGHDARFTMAYSSIGASPDGGSTYFLPRLVGSRRAAALTLLSDTIDANSAQSLGLINFVVPADKLGEETQRLMQRLVSGPTLAYAETKRLLNASADHDLETHLEA